MQPDPKQPSKTEPPAPSGIPGAGGRVGSWDPSSAADAMGLELPAGIITIPRGAALPRNQPAPPVADPERDRPTRAIGGLADVRSNDLFATPLMRYRVVADGLNAALAALVSERSSGNRWRSANDFLSWTAETATLGGLIVDAVSYLVRPAPRIDVHGWATALARGGYLEPHAHAHATWTGVYFVDAGDSGPDAGGMLTLRDPRPGTARVSSASSRDGANLEIAPCSGELLVFPGWLVHGVTPYDGVRPRISVGFSAR